MANETESWRGIPSDRIVAVLARLDSGRIQVGSGYLLTSNSVITARHCGADKKTGRPAVGLQVIRLSDGFASAAEITAASLDIAVLTISDPVPGSFPLPQFGRVDTTHSAELTDCEAMGFPLWQLDTRDQRRNAAEIHGAIRSTEGAEDGLLVLRDHLLADVRVPDGVSAEDRSSSAWGGLSGALVFRAGIALGVVTEHYPQRGSALTLLPVQRLALLARTDQDAAAVAAALGLPAGGELPAAGTTGRRPGDSGPAAGKRLILAVASVDGEDGRSAWLTVQLLRSAGISPEHCERQDGPGGSRLIIVPAGLDPAFALPAVLRAARAASDQVNAEPGRRLRVLLAAGCGAIQLSSAGYVGPGVDQAQLMTTADGRRLALRETDGAELAAMISDQLYLDICDRNPGGIEPARFRAVVVPMAGSRLTSRCWVHVPERAVGPGFSDTVPGSPPADSKSLSLEVIPLAGIGTAQWWASSHPGHPPAQAAGGDHEPAHQGGQAAHDAIHDQGGYPDNDVEPGHSADDGHHIPGFDHVDQPDAAGDHHHDFGADEFTPADGDDDFTSADSDDDFTSADGDDGSSDYGDASGW